MLPGCTASSPLGCPGSANCSVHFLEQQIDHFNWAPPLSRPAQTTFKQRYFLYDRWWLPQRGAPVFFYFGNEDNVELYVNHTGLMWESAEAFGALLVFAEHRYYGESVPYTPGTPGCMSFLTSEQAMADYAYLIDHLRENKGARSSPIIGFGGSYGGMLAAWFRVHYPNAVDGVIAASAPIWSFAGLQPAYDYNAFNQGITFDASSAGGTSDRCKDNLKAAWPRILGAGKTVHGRQLLSSAFRTCSPVRPKASGHDDAYSIVQWAQGVWGSLAMGNYPYASSYILHGKTSLPAWPLRAACAHLSGFDAPDADDSVLFSAVREAAATYHNNTGNVPCFRIGGAELPSATRRAKMTSPLLDVHSGGEAVDAAHSCTGSWGYQWCTEMTQPFTQGTSKDLFFCPNGTFYARKNCSAWGYAGSAAGCRADWAVTPRKEWAKVVLGGKHLSATSNIVFSNGQQDPWHGGGVLQNLSETVLAILLPNGAHHIDLMFSDPVDAKYPDIEWAREFERAQISRWIQEHKINVGARYETARDARLA